MTHGLRIGDWCWHVRHATPCQVVDRQDVWGETAFRIWLPAQDAVVRARAQDLRNLMDIRLTAEQIVHAAASAKLLDALDSRALLAPIQSSVVPLPHQLHALNRAMSRERVRCLLADEVGLGKTIEAGLILRELKLRGNVRRALVVAPKGLVRQWQAEMRLHFGETFRLVDPTELAAFRRAFGDGTEPGPFAEWPQRGRHKGSGNQEDDNPWLRHDQVICSLDSVKPIDHRRGWSRDQLATYNRERFENLVAANWDLVIIDEAHRLGGSTEQVARYKLGAALADATPYLLLLSATPHQGKTDHFLRLMQLLDREAFPDEGSLSRNRVHPFVIRTEKRATIDEEGRALFKPRATRLLGVEWQDRHAAQRRLYDAVTSYVRHGYNQAMAAQQRHIGFLMILMQRLVTSSTAAIRTTLEKRLALLQAPAPQASLFAPPEWEDWAELDGQSQLDTAVYATGSEDEKAEVKTLLDLARETERQGTDAKAETLLELIYRLQQEENDPQLKVLVFTEFVPTQAMLAKFLEGRGFSVAQLNGGMDLQARIRAQQAFAGDVRVLISTDAGGEGLNLQFCHIVINFDMPWNPMRIEQRIGRVDRIGQQHAVRAFNFVLHDTVEHRVRQVLEDKLALIAQEFGVDKAADVMDSAAIEPIFDELFVQGIQNPASIDRQCEAVIAQVRERLDASRKDAALLQDNPALDAAGARKWRDHPAQYWLERALTSGLPARGGQAEKSGDSWTIRWIDGSVSPRVCFDARTAEHHPEIEWVTLEDPRARSVIEELPRWAPGQPLPRISVSGLPDTIQGIWSLWEVSLRGTDSNANRKRFLPIFATDHGRTFLPSAQRIWDLLLTETVTVEPAADVEGALAGFELSQAAAKAQGERVFSELFSAHRAGLAEERERATYAFGARKATLSRIGLPAVRAYRRKQLEAEHDERMATLKEAEGCLPELSPLLMLRIGGRSVPG